ncbi:MAG: hypothetical protein LC713_03045 [Actinobacteria bacterium]|nr:hypothetical protein [Actinomycetota bacterium]
MIHRLVGATAATVVVALAGAAPSSAAAPTCRQASQAPGVHVIARNSTAVVFRTHKGSIFGCRRSGRRAYRVDVCCEGEKFKLAGHFLAYEYQGSAIGDETVKIGLIDLKNGRPRVFAKLEPNSEGPGQEVETYSFGVPFFVTSTGSLIWFQAPIADNTGKPLGAPELRAVDGSPAAERVVDSGNIDAKSIRLGADQRTITYTKDGQPQTAQLKS